MRWRVRWTSSELSIAKSHSVKELSSQIPIVQVINNLLNNQDNVIIQFVSSDSNSCLKYCSGENHIRKILGFFKPIGLHSRGNCESPNITTRYPSIPLAEWKVHMRTDVAGTIALRNFWSVKSVYSWFNSSRANLTARASTHFSVGASNSKSIGEDHAYRVLELGMMISFVRTLELLWRLVHLTVF